MNNKKIEEKTPTLQRWQWTSTVQFRGESVHLVFLSSAFQVRQVNRVVGMVKLQKLYEAYNLSGKVVTQALRTTYL